LVHQTYLDLAALRHEIKPFYGLIDGLTWLPGIGGDVSAAPSLLEMGVSLTNAGDILVTALQPVLAAGLNGQTPKEELIQVAVQALAEAGPAFERAQAAVVEAQAYRRQIQAERLSPRLARQIERLDQLWPLADPAFRFGPLAPDLLGAEGPQTYMIIAQNNDELRATGGFISSVGLLTIDQGRIAGLAFEDSYAIDDFSHPYPDPPSPLYDYMLSEIWVFRDANWSPDFPTSARAMIDLYHVSRQAKIDGVIAVDQIALQQIVEALEPVSVPNWTEPATGENVIELIRQSWSPGEDFAGYNAEIGWDPEWMASRKSFVSDLTGTIRQRIETSPGTVNWPKLAAAMLAILDERHGQIWLANDAAQTLIRKYGWDGSIREADQDFLMVVDTNMGFNKVNAVTKTALVYEVRLAEGQAAEATLRINHDNPGDSEGICSQVARYGNSYRDIINRCFWNYLRVYAPTGAQLLDATPHETPAEFLWRKRAEPAQVQELPTEGGKTVWGTFFMVPAQGNLETLFHYSLPDRIISRQGNTARYRLLVQKQAGTPANELQVIIHLPAQRRLIGATPQPVEATADGQVIFKLSLQHDQEIEVIFE
jgi:hypothetical protein